MKQKTKNYIYSILIALGVGGLSALFTSGNMDIYKEIVKPPLSPPSILFPIVWSILFTLMGISAAMIKNNNIAIVPLLSGSGIRIKIIEAMAMGKTVITTMVGAEGIQYSEYVNIIIADNPTKIMETICRITKEPEELKRIGRNARKLVENIYDNKKIIERLLIFYDEIKKENKDITYINQ